MNFLQTLYINQGKDPFHDSFGWAAPEYHLISWALSCLQLHKIYGNVSLYGNTPAVRLLIDTLQLPYSKAYLTHDELIPVHPDLWALSKIHTYSLQEQPFLHIDSDAFIFLPFFNLVVYEASDTGFSLYDIDETDHSVLLVLGLAFSISAGLFINSNKKGSRFSPLQLLPLSPAKLIISFPTGFSAERLHCLCLTDIFRIA